MQEPQSFPIIETKRLLLREITRSDAANIFAIHGDPKVMRWFGADPLPDLTAAENLIQKFAKTRTEPMTGTRWAIELRSNPGLIGTCGFFDWNSEWRKCLLGYELAPQAQGSGYMSEALQSVLSWGFENMVLNRVEALIHPDNLASLKIAKRLGFIEEGRLRQVGFWRGQFHDMLQFSLLRSERP